MGPAQVGQQDASCTADVFDARTHSYRFHRSDRFDLCGGGRVRLDLPLGQVLVGYKRTRAAGGSGDLIPAEPLPDF
jgi:hypothetical protein